MNEDIGNQKEGPQLIFDIGDDQALLRPYVYGWEICWQRKVKDKEIEGEHKTIWQGEKFFGTLVSAVNALFEYKLRACDATTLKELQKQIKTIGDELTRVYNTTIKGGK